MKDVFLDILVALRNYIYGAGWLIIAIQFTIIGYRLFDRLCPIDFKKELENQNMAFALLLGLFMLGLSFGALYFAAHMS